ncbi:MAG TPA: hypothetical protein VFP19_00625, partial [Candidatus Limnocylindrales bacterium]|nr:hypothetical protein [Candidatus Limnocylindrales bacterium]
LPAPAAPNHSRSVRNGLRSRSRFPLIASHPRRENSESARETVSRLVPEAFERFVVYERRILGLAGGRPAGSVPPTPERLEEAGS